MLLGFIIGVFVGAVFGVFLLAILQFSHKDENDIEASTDDKIEAEDM